MNDIKSILLSLGYKLHDDGARFWRTSALFREGDNGTALRISKKNGAWKDFVEDTYGSFQKLIQLSLGLPKLKEAKKWLEDKSFTVQQEQIQDRPKVTLQKTYDPKVLEKLIRTHGYWNKRGIKTEVVEQFLGGVALANQMADRYVFPIFNGHDKIIGFAGRDITDKKTIKWKLLGEKMKWAYPLYFNKEKIVEKGEAILVESIGDMLKLWQSGFENTICLFGVSLSDKIISALVGLNLRKIYISTNNDIDNNNVGNRKACDIYLRLIKFIDKDKLQIKLPLKKDFGDMTEEEIIKWKSLTNLAVVGTREFYRYEKLAEVLEPYKATTGMVISGGAKGTDTMGARWAHENNIPLIEFIPEWDKYGKAAGFIRNEYIIANCDKAVAVWRPESRGTENDIEIAKRTNKPIEIMPYNA